MRVLSRFMAEEGFGDWALFEICRLIFKDIGGVFKVRGLFEDRDHTFSNQRDFLFSSITPFIDRSRRFPLGRLF